MFSYSKKALIVFSVAGVLLLTSCAGGRGFAHGGRGGGGGGAIPALIIGGIIGGVIGHEIASDKKASPKPTLNPEEGISVGGNIGRHMAEIDRIYVARSLETVRTDVPTSWYNSDTDYEYRVVPTRTYIVDDKTCRDYTVEATHLGQTEQVFDSACRQLNGRWRVRN